MKKLLFIFTTLLIFLSVTGVNAAECTYEELKELKALASKVEVGYYSDSLPTDENQYFSVYAYNLDSKFVIDGFYKREIFNKNNLKKVSIGRIYNGSTYKATIYASSKTNCEGEKVGKINITLPTFNEYSTYKECENLSIDICKKWYDTSKLSEKEFKAIINNNKTPSIIENIISFILSNIITIIFLIFAILLAIAMYIYLRKKKKKIDL